MSYEVEVTPVFNNQMVQTEKYYCDRFNINMRSAASEYCTIIEFINGRDENEPVNKIMYERVYKIKIREIKEK